MSRGPYAKVAARNGALLERVRELKADHPFWGYRRVWAYLRYIDGLTVNQKRVYGVMKANDLLVKPNPKLRARRKADTRKPRPSRPNEWWGIDMTKVMVERFGWVYLVVVLDLSSHEVAVEPSIYFLKFLFPTEKTDSLEVVDGPAIFVR